MNDFRKSDNELKLKQKEYHDKRHRVFDLPSLSPHDFVYINDDVGNRKKGEIVKCGNIPRSYVVKPDTNFHGNVTRNRKHLTVIPSQQNIEIPNRNSDVASTSRDCDITPDCSTEVAGRLAVLMCMLQNMEELQNSLTAYSTIEICFLLLYERCGVTCVK